MKKLFYLLLSGVLVFASCKKYEEGPTISLLPKKERLAGKWKLDKRYENGQQQTLSDDDKDDIIELEKDGGYTQTDPGTSTVTGTWEFADNKEKIIVTTEVDWGFGKTSYETEYTIIRLANKELWVEYMAGNNLYEMHLVPA